MADKKRSSVYDCSFIELPKNHFPEGNLTYIYNGIHLPFDVKRVFYSYDIPGGESRGAHAHKECHQFLIAASGSFEVVLDDGRDKRTVLLNRPFYGLHVPPGIWAAEQGFSSGSVCLVLVSHKYAAEDYIRDYDEFMKYRMTDIQKLLVGGGKCLIIRYESRRSTFPGNPFPLPSYDFRTERRAA